MIVKIELDLDKEDDLLFYNRMKIVDGACNAMFEITNNMRKRILNELELSEKYKDFDRYDVVNYVFEKIHEELNENGVNRDSFI
jgi:aminopeptidase C